MGHCICKQSFTNIVHFVSKKFAWIHTLSQPCIYRGANAYGNANTVVMETSNYVTRDDFHQRFIPFWVSFNSSCWFQVYRELADIRNLRDAISLGIIDFSEQHIHGLSPFPGKYFWYSWMEVESSIRKNFVYWNVKRINSEEQNYRIYSLFWE